MKPYYQEPNIIIINDDCLNAMKELPDKSIDLVLTDPPYIQDNHGGGDNKNWWRNLNQTGHLEFVSNGFSDEILNEFERVCKIVNILIFCSNKQISKLMNFFEMRKYSTTLLAWHKKNAIPFGNGKYISDIEFILFVRGKNAPFNNSTNKENSKLFQYNYPTANRLHPTEKPIEILSRLLKIHSNENDTILDPFLGSGTTARACKDLGRKCIGIEISKKYCDIAVQRLAQEVLSF